jgi:hypothetical protein
MFKKILPTSTLYRQGGVRAFVPAEKGGEQGLLA